MLIVGAVPILAVEQVTLDARGIVVNAHVPDSDMAGIPYLLLAFTLGTDTLYGIFSEPSLLWVTVT
jgi:hypothetical protein